MQQKHIQKIDSFDLPKIRNEAAKILANQPIQEVKKHYLAGKEFYINWFVEYASNLINRRFEIDIRNQHVIASLWDYFFNPAKFDRENNVYSSGKGILLYGEPGSGKTELIRILNTLVKGDKIIEFDFARFYNMTTLVEDLGNRAFKRSTKNIFFDELGLERSKAVKHYGNQIDVDEEVILIRYDEFRNGTVTHFTTNLTADMMKARYNPRVLSRLNEMCNLMSLTGVDRRITARPIRKY